MDSKINNRHTHDDRYYTKTEIDNEVADISLYNEENAHNLDTLSESVKELQSSVNSLSAILDDINGEEI